MKPKECFVVDASLLHLIDSQWLSHKDDEISTNYKHVKVFFCTFSGTKLIIKIKVCVSITSKYF